MSTDITDNSNKEEKVEPKTDYKRISLTFVDSIFNQIPQSTNEKDPLNSSAKEFYSKQPKTQNLEQQEKSTQNQPDKPIIQEQSEKPKQEESKNSQKVSQTPKKKEIPKNPVKYDKKSKTNIKNTKKSNVEKSSTAKKNIPNNYNNSYKQKKLMLNASAKNINNNKNNQNNQNKDLKINKTKSNVRNINKDKKAYSIINENFKAKIESDKEKKLYQEKVRLLENRILALKNHEDTLHRHMHFNDVRQTYLNKRRKEKNDMKQALLSYDIDKRNELDLKRKTIQEQKKNLNKHLKESMDKSKMTKMKDYENMQKEKKLALSIINENNNKIEEYGRENVYKIKKEREKIKNNENKRQKNFEKNADNFYLETLEDNKAETNKLKEKLKKLEKLEIKYMNSLNKTRQGLLRNNSQGFYVFKKGMAPITKLDLDQQMEKPFQNKERTMYKKNQKNTASVDNLNKFYNKKKKEKSNDKKDNIKDINNNGKEIEEENNESKKD